ncbi:MAG: PPOX class F420-dependent oxidoreductase [Candidatus Acidiferrales bacterium]
MSSANPIQVFEAKKYLCLETFRKSGEGVRTPVWFAAGTPEDGNSSKAVLCVYSVADSGKVKRIRNNPRVRVAPCDMRGVPLGDFVEARAEILNGEEAARGMRLLNRKYWVMKPILDVLASLRRHERVVFAIHLA